MTSQEQSGEQDGTRFLPWLEAVVAFELRAWWKPRRAGVVAVTTVGAVLPLIMIWLFAPKPGTPGTAPGEVLIFREALFQGYFLRFVLYFGLMSIFLQPVNQEATRQCLHHFFLTPLPRGMLILGKYVAGLILMVGPMVGAALALGGIPLLLVESSQLQAHLAGPGVEMLLRYALVAGLACTTYGALFIGAAYLTRSAAVWVLGFYLWEWLSDAMPTLLKPLSVIYHLQALCPFASSQAKMVEVVTERESPVLALLWLLAISAVSLGLGRWKLSRTEIRYDSVGG